MDGVHLRFGEWLADRLFEANLTQTEFGLIIGREQSTVSGWVSGGRPGRAMCYRIADYFDTPRAEVLEMAGYKPSIRDEAAPKFAPSVPIAPGTNVPSPDSTRIGYYSEQDIRDIARSEMARVGGFVSIQVKGRIPADTTRWAEWEHEGRTVPIRKERLGSRSPDQFFVLVVSGDCLASHRIFDGAEVLIRKLDPGEIPAHGRITVVRIGDEYTLKVWSVEDGRTRLRDGDGNLIVELDTQDDVQVIGVVVRASYDFE